MNAPTMSHLEGDLRERWVPSETQIRLADARLADATPAEGRDGVITIHLLVNKSCGWWTSDVEVVHLDGVFADRMEALGRLNAEAERYHRETRKPVTGGWAWHSRPGEWAVFEDIGTQYGASG